MNVKFDGVKLIPILELGVSQIHLNERKISEICKWFDPREFTNYPPLPVYDFGDGRFTLTDGHSRAYLAYRFGITHIPVVYDCDEMVTSELGLLQYRKNIEWCQRYNISTVGDLENRIVSDSQYRELWVERCDKSYNLLTNSTESVRKAFQEQHPQLFLYGSNENLSVLFFEDLNGALFNFINE